MVYRRRRSSTACPRTLQAITTLSQALINATDPASVLAIGAETLAVVCSCSLAAIIPHDPALAPGVRITPGGRVPAKIVETLETLLALCPLPHVTHALQCLPLAAWAPEIANLLAPYGLTAALFFRWQHPDVGDGVIVLFYPVKPLRTTRISYLLEAIAPLLTTALARALLAAAATLAQAETRMRLQEELHHRVRNNLAILCALLEMEMLNTAEADRHRLRVTLARIRSLALVYDLLLEEHGEWLEVGALARGVVDGVLSLYEHARADIPMVSVDEVLISSRKGTYLALALTELALHIIRCAQEQGQRTVPAITITTDADTITLTVESPACTPDAGSTLAFDPLGRTILVGLIERSLRGAITLVESTAPFRAFITIPRESPTG